mgnify:FL=1|jgi:hypothetical protein
MVTTTTLLPLVGVAVLCATFASAALWSRGRLPFAPSEGLFVAASVGGVSLVAQSLVNSDLKTVAILFVGWVAWGIGYETGRGGAER